MGVPLWRRSTRYARPRTGRMTIQEKDEVKRRQYRREAEQLAKQRIDPDKVQGARLL